jgi:hypothetical protein
MPYALCPMPYALCPMPYALCPLVPHLSEKGYIFTQPILPLLLLGAIHTVLSPKIV